MFLDRQLQILQIYDPRLHKPLTLVNLYVRGDSAADSCQWDFLRDLSDTYENLIVVGDFSARHFSWDSAGVNPNGRGLAEALLDLDRHLLNTGEPTRLAERPGDTQGRDWQVRGPIWSIFAGPHSVVCRHFWGGAWRNDRNRWYYKARPERLTPRPLQQRPQCAAPLNPITQRITTLINTSSLMSVVPPKRRCIECCASGYPELKSLQ